MRKTPMSVQTTTTCDRCRRKIEADGLLLGALAGSAPPRWVTDPSTGRPGFDLCRDCLEALLRWLAQDPRQDGPGGP
jgi:hypothetical protein